MSEAWLRCLVAMLLCMVVAGAARSEVVYPARTGRVVDQAGLLSLEARERLSALLAEHEQKTSNQVVVVTVNSLQGLQIETYSLSLANSWGVGQAGRNNGVVLLVAPNERQVRIEVGIGLRHRLTDRIAADIIEQRMLPVFRDGRYQAGIQEGVSGILSALYGAYQVERPRSEGQWGQWTKWVVIALFVGAAGVIVISVVSSGQLGNVGSDDDDRSGSWCHDDDRGHRSSSWSRSSFGSSSFGSSGFGGGSSHGGGSFRGGGASGRW